MPIFRLPEQIPENMPGDLVFPPVHLAEPDGMLAVGGDLTETRLIAAYRLGIFPWYNEGDPIIWWSPDPRSVLAPAEAYVSKTMRQFMRRTNLEVRADTAFEQVIDACATQPRPKQEDGSWITEAMKEAYIQLHRSGTAHSVEVWDGDELVGGLYGLSMGGCFFGESMFSRVSNASKLAFLTMAGWLQQAGFSLIDCQVHNQHLESLGAREISRLRFLELLDQGLSISPKFDWSNHWRVA